MRRESYAIPGGADGLRLFPETAAEAAFTSAERALICGMLKRSDADYSLAVQLDSARVTLRELDGYGAFVEFTLAELPGMDAASGPSGGADTFFWTTWRADAGLNAFIVPSASGLLIDIYPIDGQNYSTQECERILFGDVSELAFCPYELSSTSSPDHSKAGRRRTTNPF